MTLVLPNDAREPLAAISRHLRVSLIMVMLLVGGVFGLLGTIRIAGAVVAPGVLVVEAGDTLIQHPSGGTVGALLVNEGDAVKAGDLLLSIEDNDARAGLAVLDAAIRQLSAKRARLMAERSGDDTIAFPADSDDAVLIGQESALFTARRLAQSGLAAQLGERISQLEQQAEGVLAQHDAKQQEIGLAETQLAATRGMREMQLAQQSVLTNAERDLARLKGELGALQASGAELRGRMAEIGLQIIQIEDDFRSKASEELSAVDSSLAELTERQAAARQSVAALDIRAPRDGVVHQMAIRALGGTVAPGQTIMTIVPTGGALLVEAQASPQAIDQLHVGQPASVRLSAFDPQTTPEVTAEVVFVAADLQVDPRTGAAFYTVRMALDAEAAAGLRLVPGMPAEAFIRTDDRTMLGYLLKPLGDQMARGFRD